MANRAITKKISALPTYALNNNNGNLLYSEGGTNYQFPLSNIALLSTLAASTVGAGASLINTTSGTNVQSLLDNDVVFRSKLNSVTPEMYKLPSDIDDTNSFVLALATGKPVVANGNYNISYGIALPSGTNLIINGTVTQTQTGSFTWTISNLQSPYSMFIATSVTDITISGTGRLVPNFEALSFSTCTDVRVSGLRIGNVAGSLSSGINAFSCTGLNLSNLRVRYSGHMGSYDSTNSRQIYGVCNGIHASGCTNMTITNCEASLNGLNGMFTGGCINMMVVSNRLLGNGCSGLQHSPVYSSVTGITSTGCIISNNYCRDNMADGIDINWTGATAIPMNGTITGNVCWFNGFFNQQTSQLTQDGGGITLRNVTHYVATGNFMRENAGVDMYLTNPTDVTLSSNVITKTVSSKAGIYVLYSATNLKINSNTVDVLGTALSMGGGMTVTRMDVSLNTLISSTAAAASFPANTYSNCSSRGNTYLGATTVNLYFKSVDDRFRYQSALTGYGVYINMSYGKFEGADINGSTSSSLVYMDGGTGNTLSTCNINNTGSGVGLTINNGTRLMILGCFLQCSSGVGASISGGYIDVMSTIFSGSTSVSSSATQLTYIGKLNQWTGTQTYTVFPWDTSVTQRTS